MNKNDPVAALAENMTGTETARLLAAVAAITAAGCERHGVQIPVAEILKGASMWVKAAAYDEAPIDMDNALFCLKDTPALQVAEHAESPASAGFAETGAVSQVDIDQLPPMYREAIRVGMTAHDIAAEIQNPEQRMNIGRALMVDKEQHNPATLEGGGDSEIARYLDQKPIEDLTPAERMNRARAGLA